MTKYLTILIAAFLLAIHSNGQSLDSLKLSGTEIPEGYVLTQENNCISIQACTFYDNPQMYEALLGKVKNKQIQNFNSDKDKGAIMYFEFEDGFKGEGFLDGLLWGGDKPTKEHPEEYLAKGNFLVMWSFNKGSKVVGVSKKKVERILK